MIFNNFTSGHSPPRNCNETGITRLSKPLSHPNSPISHPFTKTSLATLLNAWILKEEVLLLDQNLKKKINGLKEEIKVDAEKWQEENFFKLAEKLMRDVQRKLEENLEGKVEERFKGIEQAVEELRFEEYEDSESQISQNDEDLPDLKIETYNPRQNRLSINSQVNSLNAINLISPKLSLFSPKTNSEVEQKSEGSQNSSPRKSKRDVNFTTKVNLPESKNLRRKSIKNSRAKRNSRVIKQDTNHGNISLLSINLPKERIEEEKTVHNRSDSIFSTASRRTVGKKRKEMIENIVNKKFNEVQLFHRLRA